MAVINDSAEQDQLLTTTFQRIIVNKIEFIEEQQNIATEEIPIIQLSYVTHGKTKPLIAIAIPTGQTKFAPIVTAFHDPVVRTNSEELISAFTQGTPRNDTIALLDILNSDPATYSDEDLEYAYSQVAKHVSIISNWFIFRANTRLEKLGILKKFSSPEAQIKDKQLREAAQIDPEGEKYHSIVKAASDTILGETTTEDFGRAPEPTLYIGKTFVKQGLIDRQDINNTNRYFLSNSDSTQRYYQPDSKFHPDNCDHEHHFLTACIPDDCFCFGCFQLSTSFAGFHYQGQPTTPAAIVSQIEIDAHFLSTARFNNKYLYCTAHQVFNRKYDLLAIGTDNFVTHQNFSRNFQYDCRPKQNRNINKHNWLVPILSRTIGWGAAIYCAKNRETFNSIVGIGAQIEACKSTSAILSKQKLQKTQIDRLLYQIDPEANSEDQSKLITEQHNVIIQNLADAQFTFNEDQKRLQVLLENSSIAQNNVCGINRKVYRHAGSSVFDTIQSDGEGQSVCDRSQYPSSEYKQFYIPFPTSILNISHLEKEQNRYNSTTQLFNREHADLHTLLDPKTNLDLVTLSGIESNANKPTIFKLIADDSYSGIHVSIGCRDPILTIETYCQTANNEGYVTTFASELSN